MRRPGGGARATFQQDLWHYTIGKMVDACTACGIKPLYGPFGDFSDPAACEAQFRNAFLMGCAGAWTLHPTQVPIAKRVFSPDPGEVAFAKAHFGGDAGWQRRRPHRRQDAGRRHLETGQGAAGSRPAGRRQGPGPRPALPAVRTATCRIRDVAPRTRLLFPGQGTPQTRDCSTPRGRDGPGSAAHHSALRASCCAAPGERGHAMLPQAGQSRYESLS